MIIRPDEYRRVPWKNGLGATAEIVRAAQDGDEFDWRVSVADVANDGPFSPYEGYDRTLVVLQGNGILLEHLEPRQTALVGPLEPYCFAGEWPTEGILRDGPIRDFNVICRRGVVAATVSVVTIEAGQSRAVTATLVYCVRGCAALGVPRETIVAGETFVHEVGAVAARIAAKEDSTLIAVAIDAA